jgi:hypothetical protein
LAKAHALHEAASMRILLLLPLAACVADAPGYQIVRDDSVGVSIELPRTYQIKKDPVLFDGTHGFLVLAPGEHNGDEVARIALAYRAKASELEAMVDKKLDQYKEVSPTRSELTLADGRRAVAVTGLPGTRGYAVVYTADADRLYEIGLWSEDGAIDDRGRDLLAHITFVAPTTTIEQLQLPRATDALYQAPPTDIAARNAIAHTLRVADYQTAIAAEPELAFAATHEIA